MILDSIIKIYDSLGQGNPQVLGFRYKSAIRLSLRTFASFAMPIIFKLTTRNSKYRLNANKKESMEEVIVSLTSFPARIQFVWQTIETILRQTHKPDRIILWLSSDQFPNGEEDLPASLIRLKQRGLEIRFVEGDIRSHKKYYYVLKECPDATVITFDDDIYYKSTLIESLISAHKEHPKSIISYYGYKIKFHENGNALPYSQWKYITESIATSREIFFGSGGGTLFPAKVMHEDVLDIEKARKLCPTADDLWLNAMCQLRGAEIVKIKSSNTPFPILIERDEHLCSDNVAGGENDKQIEALRREYTEYNLFTNPAIKK